MSAPKIIFITGTDTGVGKTLLTALLLHHSRKSGSRTLAMKPFCSGGLEDVRVLQALQPGELSNAEMNPFYFKEPIAPLVAARKNRRKIKLKTVIRAIKHGRKNCDRLLVEGSGGLLVPLGEKYTVADLIARLKCAVIVVARNKLGTINHTLLTINVLSSYGIPLKSICVVLMGAKKKDHSSVTNQQILGEFLKPVKVFQIPFLGEDASNIFSLKKAAHLQKRILSAILKESE